MDEAVLKRLDREDNAWLSTSRPDGSPHLTPVWFVYEAAWWVCVLENSVKYRNMRRDPRVSLALEDGLAPVVAEGVATIHTTGFPQRIVDAFAAKYDGWDIGKPYQGIGRVLFEIPVTRWLLAGVAQ
ncbi:TIGR03618 family F420-dependent PPOX class oxidoreductase [Amycolatopsis sp. NPDC059657]|uniref:TIGR03618 family F420-dependent PPOX class oxidoreductase n=1 Tax=Amycolatopsis sp. NPDC059657 TaxID=3346899 RepID=UPI00366F7152